MKVLLTGITGNLGYEVASDLTRRGFVVVPIIRPNRTQTSLQEQFKEIIYSDLTSIDNIQFTGTADCIVHCAGIVHLKNAGNTNEKMMQKVIDLAQRLKVPVYFISTAFVYKPSGIKEGFNNSYEKDKWQSEQILIKSGVSHGIFRPSVLVGNSKTGEIQNFSGYYLVIGAFLAAINNSMKQGLKIRFPRLSGKADMITVDQAAQSIGDAIEHNRLENLFITNPNPLTYDWVLNKSLEFFGVNSKIEFLECSFEEFGKLNLTEIERKLYQFGAHFNSYWSLAYNFPDTICTENLITEEYLSKILGYFQKSKNFSNDKANY
jgi:nucleoside-diphosphate-sugar epimerase